MMNASVKGKRKVRFHSNKDITILNICTISSGIMFASEVDIV